MTCIKGKPRIVGVFYDKDNLEKNTGAAWHFLNGVNGRSITQIFSFYYQLKHTTSCYRKRHGSLLPKQIICLLPPTLNGSNTLMIR
uniref:Uncharacterized protein n=1 Tax=Arundo donax TaxID=35708 RepID=A0A0A9D0A5_ARUDO